MRKPMQAMSMLILLLTPAFLYALDSQNPNNDKPKPIPHYVIKITSPQDQETFQNSTQSMTVTVSVTPELLPEDKVVIYVDGTASGEPTHSTSINIPWLPRGSHTLKAKIIQPKGQGAETNTITIFQQRSTRLIPPH